MLDSRRCVARRCSRPTGTKTWTPNQCELAVAHWEDGEEHFDARVQVGPTSAEETANSTEDFMCGCVNDRNYVVWSTDGECPDDAAHASSICRVLGEDADGNERVSWGWGGCRQYWI